MRSAEQPNIRIRELVHDGFLDLNVVLPLVGL